MGFSQWREDRKLRKKLDPEEYEALKRADAQFEENSARGIALADRDAQEAVRRVRDVQGTALDPYLKAGICYCIEAGVDVLRTVAAEARIAHSEPDMESPPAELWSFINAYDDDEKWAAALDIASWAYVACFVQANYQPEFDAGISAANEAMRLPAEGQQVVEAARALDDTDESMSAFAGATFESVHLRTAGALPSSPEALDYALALWYSGWDTGIQTLNDRLDDYIARGG